MHLKQYQDKVHRTPVSLTLSPDLQTQHLKGLQKYFNCFFFFLSSATDLCANIVNRMFHAKNWTVTSSSFHFS